LLPSQEHDRYADDRQADDQHDADNEIPDYAFRQACGQIEEELEHRSSFGDILTPREYHRQAGRRNPPQFLVRPLGLVAHPVLPLPRESDHSLGRRTSLRSSWP
jgi:hypothetical protein